MNLITAHKVQRSLLICSNFERVHTFLKFNQAKNSLFYLYDGISPWKQVLTLNSNSKIVFNDIDFNSNGLALIQDNLQG